MGRGGVPGAATIAGSAFVILAKPGQVNSAMGKMLMAESIPNFLVAFVYRKQADWGFVIRNNLFTVVGLVIGAFVNDFLDDESVKRALGAVLLLVVAQVLGEKFLQKRNSS